MWHHCEMKCVLHFELHCIVAIFHRVNIYVSSRSSLKFASLLILPLTFISLQFVKNSINIHTYVCVIDMKVKLISYGKWRHVVRQKRTDVSDEFPSLLGSPFDSSETFIRLRSIILHIHRSDCFKSRNMTSKSSCLFLACTVWSWELTSRWNSWHHCFVFGRWRIAVTASRLTIQYKFLSGLPQSLHWNARIVLRSLDLFLVLPLRFLIL
jgi:hypothetical protein